MQCTYYCLVGCEFRPQTGSESDEGTLVGAVEEDWWIHCVNAKFHGTALYAPQLSQSLATL